MSKTIELTKITIIQKDPPHRQAFIKGFEDEPVDYGVHPFMGHRRI